MNRTPRMSPLPFREVLHECFAVQALAEITEEAVEALKNGDPTARTILSQIKQCDYCKKWIFASHGEQRFCPAPSNCRQLFWAAGQGKKYRKYQKHKQRKYRKRKKDRARSASVSKSKK